MLTAPPPGGFTAGPVGATDLDAFVEAQSFDVAAIWFFRLGTQDYVSYIPGAPAFVNTLDAAALEPDSVVVVTRAPGEAGESTPPPAAKEEFVSSETPPPLLWTGYYYLGAAIVSKIAGYLGKE